MRGMCKKGWLWDFFIKFSFVWIQNLTSYTYRWMLDHISHCAVIVADDDINDKEAVIECILYHLQYSRSLYNVWASLEVLWELMFFWFFSSLLCIITLPEGCGIEYHSNDPLASSTNDEGMPARGVIYLTRWYLLPSHIICNGNFNLVVIFSLIW